MCFEFGRMRQPVQIEVIDRMTGEAVFLDQGEGGTLTGPL
jgi:hypothetical protein